MTEASWQREIAQKLCDMGVDAIIGGHPHVIEPVDVFTSEDGLDKTFCAFSLGNQLSNQRREMMRLKTGNTEDGLFIDLEITRNKNFWQNRTMILMWITLQAYRTAVRLTHWDMQIAPACRTRVR